MLLYGSGVFDVNKMKFNSIVCENFGEHAIRSPIKIIPGDHFIARTKQFCNRICSAQEKADVMAWLLAQSRDTVPAQRGGDIK